MDMTPVIMAASECHDHYQLIGFFAIVILAGVVGFVALAGHKMRK